MKKTTFLLIISLAFWGCVTFSQSYKLGTEAAVNKDWDEAVRYYEKAVLEDAENSVYRIALFRAKVSASYMHLVEARKLASDGREKEALSEYERALYYDPSNRAIAEEARGLTEEKVEEKREKVVKIEPPIRLKAGEENIQLKFIHEASLRSIFQALGKYAHVNVIFDEMFKDKPFSVDLADMNFEQAVSFLCMASKNFYRTIDEKTIIIIPDNIQNRMRYELNAMKTFYLSNINAQDIMGSLSQALRTSMKAPVIMVDKNLNSITVKDTPQVVELAERIIKLWDKPKGEVVIDIEIMEVSRIKLREMGLDFDQNIVGLIYTGAEGITESAWQSMKGIDFSKSENYQITLPTAFLRFLESDVDTKIIAQPRLRGVEGEKIEYMVGDEVPIPQTTFSPIAAGGISQQPVTQYQFKNVGIDVKITPRIHYEKEITLELEIKIKALGGTGFADIPIITTREVKNVIRLKDGETNLLAGLLKDEERKTVKGITGLKNVPVLGGLFSRTDQTIQQTDVIMTITPYILRMIPLKEEDSKPLWVNLERMTSGQTVQGRSEEEILEAQMRRERLQRDRESRMEGGGQNQVFLNPVNFEGPQNREFRIHMSLNSEYEIGNMSIGFSFNSRVLELKQILLGGYIQQFGKNPSFLKNIDNDSGICTIGFTSPDLGKGFKGQGRIVTLVFRAKTKGESAISFSDISANTPSGQAVVFSTRESHIRIK